MPDPAIDPVPAPGDAGGRPSRRSVLPVLLALIAALLVGMGAMAWLFHRFDQVAQIVKPTVPVIVPPAPQRRPRWSTSRRRPLPTSSRRSSTSGSTGSRRRSTISTSAPRPRRARRIGPNGC
ncbi:hypothetical protein ACFSTI_16230 [Rhizorhabdus histidinilytica]